MPFGSRGQGCARRRSGTGFAVDLEPHGLADRLVAYPQSSASMSRTARPRPSSAWSSCSTGCGCRELSSLTSTPVRVPLTRTDSRAELRPWMSGLVTVSLVSSAATSRTSSASPTPARRQHEARACATTDRSSGSTAAMPVPAPFPPARSPGHPARCVYFALPDGHVRRQFGAREAASDEDPRRGPGRAAAQADRPVPNPPRPHLQAHIAFQALEQPKEHCPSRIVHGPERIRTGRATTTGTASWGGPRDAVRGTPAPPQRSGVRRRRPVG